MRLRGFALTVALMLGTGGWLALESLGQQNPFIDRSIKFKIPSNAIPLRTVRVFPNEKDEDEGLYIGHAQSLAMDSNGLFYVPDDRNDEILVFSQEGRLVNRFGKTGQGPGDFMRPTGVACGPDYVWVRESQNGRFQFFDFKGKYMGGFRPSKYYQPFLVEGDSIIGAEMHYQSPEINDRASLITIMNREGRVLNKFGQVIDEKKPYNFPLNEVCLALTKNRHLAVAFRFFPILRIYSLAGVLIREISSESGIIDVFAPMNKKALEAAVPGGNTPQGYLANGVFADGDGIYIVIAASTRLEILRYDENGERKEYFFKNLDEWLGCAGLIVVNRQDGKHFFILRMNPAYAIEELVPVRG